MKRDVRVEWRTSAPPEQVWTVLTDRDHLSRWLMENDFKPSVGRSFRFQGPFTPGWKRIVEGKVLEVDPARKLVYTWSEGPEGKKKGETLVHWTLEPEGGGTRLLLEQAGFRGLSGVFTSWILEFGWKRKLSGDPFMSSDGKNPPNDR